MAKIKKREEIAYQYIKEKIELKKWLPHEHLREQDIAEQLKMSRTPIRKAFQRLQKEKKVHIEPYKGVRILKPQIDSKEFQERLEYIELMMNHYIFKLEEKENTIAIQSIRVILEEMKSVLREQTDLFEEKEQEFWKLFLAEEKNDYSRILILDTIHTSFPSNGRIRQVLKQSRKTKYDHLEKIIDYMEEGNYAYARREVRILLNQINLNVIQGI